MEAILQARKLFLKCHHHQASLTDIDKAQLRKDIQRFITIAIKEATSKDLFENTCVLNILKSALRQRACDNSDVMPVAKAFRSLEKYFLLLVEQPWKPEFREIKMYGGFYRTRVKSVLPDCETIFEHAGYMVLPESCTMIYKGPMNKTFLLLLAFDCRVGQVECETIAEHYNKVKGLSMSLSDAISNILHDEYTRDKPVLSYHLNKSNDLIVNMPPMSKITVPPALPKREPLVSNLNVHQNGRCDPDIGAIHDFTVNSAGKYEAGVSFPPKSPNRTSDLYSSVLTQPPVTPSSVIPESFTYMDTQVDEIIPELPQGTSEDHIWESLRHLKLHEAPRPHVPPGGKQLNTCNENKNGTLSNNSHYTTPPAYSVNGLNALGVVAQGNFKPAHSIDEGIELDMPTSKPYPNSTKYVSHIGQQITLPNKTSHQQPSYDQGYRTVNPESIYSTSSGSHNLQHMIYHPPNIITDSPSPGLLNKALISSVPPPIPSRALKPKPVNDEDCSRGKIFMSAPHFTSPQPLGVGYFQSELIVNQPPISAPGYSTYSQSVKNEPVLRRERLALGKTSSLKVGETFPSMSKQVAISRTARSMDLSSLPWECQSCTTKNLASNLICVACSHSRRGPDISQPALGQTKKECSSCTFVNSPDMAHCEICGSKLNDKSTCV